MDSVLSSALEEICSSGADGLSLYSLVSKLNLSPSSLSLKQSVYQNLRNVPSLQLIGFGNKVFDRNDASIRRFEDAERIDLRIVGSQEMRDHFLGLYDAPNIKSMERKVLERLSLARSNGITQNELAKEFNMGGKNLFYILKVLECQKLIVRQPAVVRLKEPDGEGESKSSSCVTTNMVYLYRYAKHLSSQQRFEINKEERSVEGLANSSESAVREDGFYGGNVKEDVLVKDYLPAMKAVCDKLKAADGKVLVISDIKRDLGYVGSPSGHKAWRSIRCRLKDAGLVEEFDARVNEKVEHCLRLLKEFSQKNFESKLIANDFSEVHHMKFGRKPQKTEQLVELPIEHQIYDMIDAKGSEGLTLLEVCERLGIDKKKNYPRFCNMISRFGMHVQAENYKKTPAYRVWTSKNCNPESSSAFSSKLEVVHSENNIPNVDNSNLGLSGISAQKFPEHNQATIEGDFASPEKWNDSEFDAEISHGSPGDGKRNHLLLCPGNQVESSQEQGDRSPDADLGLVSTALETNVAPSGTTLSASLKPLGSGVYPIKPRQALTADAARREQRILEWLQDKKFVLRPELFRWLVNLEKDKSTTMDRKTIDRILNKLHQQGHCKCMHINVPAVTNCGRSRITQVVLHPSVQSLSPELLSEIHDRLRSFEMQSRIQSSSKCKNNESVPILDGVQRTQNYQVSDATAVKAEVMRANGFVLAKMVRAKLLHIFLWDYLSSLPGWDYALSSGKNVNNSYGTCNIFELESAIKAIPLEIFLQVAGSTQKFDDMVEKCKRGLCLSDLPVQEYKLLMDSQATSRLSKVIDILRRLKLVRLVTNGPVDDEVKLSLANLMHAMELKPYIEEPVSVVAASINRSLDLRPRIRHDFVLSNREAVIEYWQTLEYCYAAADPRAALHAFPGSSVHEVFLFRSWSAVRVMTAEQRAELLKCVTKENINEKLSFKKCEKIAKDLNLTLEQVLRVYYDKLQKRLNRFEGVQHARAEEHPRLKKTRASSSRKRKRSLEASSVKVARVDAATRDSNRPSVAKLPDTINQAMGEQNLLLESSGEHDVHLPAFQEDEHIDTVEEMGTTEEDEACKPTRQRRFSWTDEADRKLLIQYVRHRAARGAKCHRVDWASLHNLPAPPSICARRMALLRRNTKFRRAVMKLCNMLGERYAKHLQRTQKKSLNDDDHGILVRCSSREDHNGSSCAEQTEEKSYVDELWDDFDDKNIRKAFEGILQMKQMAKLEAPKRLGTAPEECSDLSMNGRYNLKGSESVLLITPSENIQNLGGGQYTISSRRSRGRRFHQKFIKLLNEGTSITRQVHESLAVSNAIELYKLVFLSTSSAPDLPNLLAETLRRYSEHDLFAAFSYLREKKIMIGGTGGQPFLLSQHFLNSICRSPFPIKTGQKAAEFSSWLNEKEENLMEVVVNLPEDLQCGDIFHLFSLVSSGELSISPHLPVEGVGEAEELRSLKRRSEDVELSDGDNAKKMKSLSEGELVSRREKGFPGIMLSISRAGISTANAVELFNDSETASRKLNGSDEFSSALYQNFDGSSSNLDYKKEIVDMGSIDPPGGTLIVGNCSESSWEAMTGYAEYLMLNNSDEKEVNPLNPEIFRAAYAAIQKAGDQGLSSDEIAQVVDVPGEKMAEYIIDVLQAFERALKVNAYDSIRVVDILYRSKYFLTSTVGFRQHIKPRSLMKSQGRIDNSKVMKPGILEMVHAESQRETSMNVDDVHKVTILNLPEEDAEPLDEGCMQGQDVLPGTNNNGDAYKLSSSEPRVPILPWINGDGTINKIIYNGLIRRVLGIVMQNPGMLENDIIGQMDVLNPQTCRKLLELMILDKHLIVREMCQSTSSGPPALLESLLGSSFKRPKLVFRRHFFANPGSTSLL